MAVLKIDNLYKQYAHVQEYAVNGLNFSCKEGEFVAILGPSGCGKTTTLRMIAGLESVSKGNIWFDDIVVNHILPKDRGIGLAFEDYALYPPLNVFDNIAFNLRAHRVSESVVKERVSEISELLHVNDILDKRPKELSGGQMQRVNIARAIVRKPKILLLDEPMSHLDGKLRQILRYEIRKLHQKIGCTTILVTHDQLEAMSLADRLVIMNFGVLQQFASPAEVYNNPNNRFVAEFIGDPPMNILEPTVVSSDSQLYFSFGFFRFPIPPHLREQVSINRQIKLGVRPDDIIFSEQGTSVPISIFENLGEEKRLTIKLDEKNILMISTLENVHCKPGDNVCIEFIKDKIHIFYE